MVTSKYLTTPIEWYDRILAMESDYEHYFYNFLYFKIALNLIDARDNADYDKEKVLKGMLNAFDEKKNLKSGHGSVITKGIQKLRTLI